MPQIKIKTPIFRILRLVVPVVGNCAKEFAAARAVDSAGGSRVTLEELEGLALEIGFNIAKVTARELARANVDIIDGLDSAKIDE